MTEITNEIERSQRWGALTAGCGDAPKHLTELKSNINLVREIASEYCTLTIKDKNTRVFFVAYFTRLLKKVNGMLPGYIEDLKQSQCIEAFGISTGQYRKEEFWQWCDWICSDMEGEKIYEYLKQNVDRLKALLLEAEIATIQCKPELYEKFFFNEELQYANDGVRKKFEKWMYDNMAPDIEKLRELQALVVADALKLGVMDYAPDPSYQEIEEVKVDYLKKLLPWNYDMSGDFTKSCARWRKFFHWEGTILVINYKKYGKYIQSHYYDFNDTQLQAIFELDMMLYLIHKEMQKLMATELPSENVVINHKPDEEPFKFIHPSICGEEVWLIHDEVKRLVSNHGIPEICDYLYQMSRDGRILLPKMPSVAYVELVRMGMPTCKGYSEKYFNKFYRK